METCDFNINLTSFSAFVSPFLPLDFAASTYALSSSYLLKEWCDFCFFFFCWWQYETSLSYPLSASCRQHCHPPWRENKHRRWKHYTAYLADCHSHRDHHSHLFDGVFSLHYLTFLCQANAILSSRGFVLIRLSGAINFISMTLTDIAVLTRTNQGYFFCFRWESKVCVPQEANIIILDIFIRSGASKSSICFNLQWTYLFLFESDILWVFTGCSAFYKVFIVSQREVIIRVMPVTLICPKPHHHQPR